MTIKDKIFSKNPATKSCRPSSLSRHCVPGSASTDGDPCLSSQAKRDYHYLLLVKLSNQVDQYCSVTQGKYSFSVVDAFSSIQEPDNVVSSRCQSGEKAYLSCAPPLKASHTAHTEEKQIPH